MTKGIVFGVQMDEETLTWPGRNQLMEALSKHVPVVYLQRPTKRSLTGIPSRTVVDRMSHNRFIMRDAFPVRTSRAGRRAAAVVWPVDHRRFNACLRDAGLSDYTYWLTVNQPPLAYGVDSRRLVYDCMDPNFLPEDHTTFDRDEFRLGRRARVVFASAHSLLERMRSVNEHAYLLPNAAPDVQPLPRRVPDRLRDVAGPVAGYLGTVDWRFDVDYVLAAAAQLPRVTFVIAGRVNADQEARVSPLRAMPNVLMPGALDLDTGEAYTQRFDVGLIPFTPSAMNDAINPVKMWMYHAHGTPVVSTDIAECRQDPFTAVGTRPVEFADAVARALDEDDDAARDARRAYAQANTWAVRARTALSVLQDRGML